MREIRTSGSTRGSLLCSLLYRNLLWSQPALLASQEGRSLTCDTFIDLHGLKSKLILILHGFRHAILDSCAWTGGVPSADGVVDPEDLLIHHPGASATLLSKSGQ
jgi:hypothetical protein